MSEIYAVGKDSVTTPLSKVLCTNEDKELQQILERNLDLLPGDQINPDEPRRWVMIKREMAVPDPTTGANRWSIDLFLADQDGIPTFVECKRHDDSRARREVVGQMLEYVANGHHYWDMETIKQLAEKSAVARGTNVASVITSFGPKWVDNIDEYFAEVERNLRAGNVRMVFVLEEASYELRSVVAFLNKQMNPAEVLLVEMRQYQLGEQRIVAPTLFGFAEQAHMVKHSPPSSERRTWDEDSFFLDLAGKVPSDQVETVRQVLRAAEKGAWDVRWGTGKENGSLSVRIPGLAKRSLFSVYSNGSLTLPFGWLNENAHEEQIRDALANFAVQHFGIEKSDDYQQRYPTVAPQKWMPAAGKFMAFLAGIAVQDAGPQAGALQIGTPAAGEAIIGAQSDD